MSELNRNQKDRDGLEYVTNYLVGQRIDELGKMGSNTVAKLNHYKGHIPSEKKQGGDLRIVDDSDHAQMVMTGYKRVSEYEGSSAELTKRKRSYYFAPVSGQAGFSQGVMQTVHQTVSGVDPETGYTVGEVMAGRITDPQQVKALQKHQANPGQTRENLIPVYNEFGQLVAYERMADVTKLAGLNRNTDLREFRRRADRTKREEA